MNNIVIFSGTTEGRTLSEHLTSEGISHIVCVATDYGKEMMKDNSCAQIHVGRMDEGQIREFLIAETAGIKQLDKETIVVVDATHPYATEATGNIKRAAESLGIKYLRLKRSVCNTPEGALCHFENIEKCADAVDKTRGSILLTTGSKELEKYCANVSKETLKRTYVRILPSEESLRQCSASGIEPSHIIAMQGPFSRELNEAIMRQYKIEHLITKESGKSGGFDDKRDAALAVGASIYVIDRPVEEGLDLKEIISLLLRDKFRMAKHREEEKDKNYSGCLQKAQEYTYPEADTIYIIGAGMGICDCLTLEAKRAIEESDAVFGAKRIVQNISCGEKHELYLAKDIIPVLEDRNIQKAAILFSGDTGFFSGATAMIRELRKWRKDLDIRVLPGISSFSALSARMEESYDDAEFFSIHGRRSEENFSGLIEKVRYHKKVFVLLSGPEDIPEIASRMKECGIDGRLTAGLNLYSDREHIKEMTLDEAKEYEAEGIVTALIRNPSPEKRLVLDLKRDSEFERGDVPMTKECVRHESIIRLGLREGDTLIDVGGGTGSVAIEAAGLDRSLMVYTIEKKSEAVELIRENIKKAGLCNITVIEGKAEDELDRLPAPDCVFIGGSSGKLSRIMEILHSGKSGIRFVINAVSMETIEEVRRLIREYGVTDEESVMLQVSEVKKAGNHHMVSANNPVWIFSFTL